MLSLMKIQVPGFTSGMQSSRRLREKQKYVIQNQETVLGTHRNGSDVKIYNQGLSNSYHKYDKLEKAIQK